VYGERFHSNAGNGHGADSGGCLRWAIESAAHDLGGLFGDGHGPVEEIDATAAEARTFAPAKTAESGQEYEGAEAGIDGVGDGEDVVDRRASHRRFRLGGSAPDAARVARDVAGVDGVLQQLSQHAVGLGDGRLAQPRLVEVR
jgi:hypothetical protein